MKSTKKFLFILLAALCCVSLLTVSAFAAEEVASGTCGDNLTWVLDDEGTLTISGTGDMVIDGECGGDEPWNGYCESITTVVLDSGVEWVTPYAFGWCDNLRNVYISDTVDISYGVFACSPVENFVVDTDNPWLSVDEAGALLIYDGAVLYQIPAGMTGTYVLPSTVEGIWEYACYETGLSSVVFPESLTYIGSLAFAWSDLTEVEFPADLVSISYGAFLGCEDLTTITFEGDAPYFDANVFMYVTANATYPLSADGWNADALSQHGGELTWIPDGEVVAIEAADDIVTYVVGDTFDPDDIEIYATYDNGFRALLDASLLEMDTPSMDEAGRQTLTVTYGTFTADVVLAIHEERESVTVDPSLYPESEHEYMTDLDETQILTVPGAEELVLTFSQLTYTEDYYDNIYLYDARDTLIASYTGGEAAGVTVTVPGDTVKVQLVSDVSETDYGYSFESIKAVSLAHVGDASDVTVEATCTEDGYTGGVNCVYCGRLAGQAIHYALGHDYESVVTPATPEANGYTTHTCSRCGDTYTDSETMYGMIAFGECGNDATWSLTEEGVMTVSGTGEMWMYDDNYAPWYDYRDRIITLVIEEGITYIGDYAFARCYLIETVEIPDTVEAIGMEAFFDCDSLTEITIPASVSDLNLSFYGCDSLTAIWVDENNPYYCSDACGVVYNKDQTALVYAPDALTGAYTVSAATTNIYPQAFENCFELTSVTLPVGLEKISSYAFSCCFSLESIEIPDTVTLVEWGAFSSCSSLKSVKLSSGLSYIDNYLFCYCNALTEIVIPDGVTTIHSEAFTGCESLASVKLPSGLTDIGAGAFVGCTALTEIDIPDGVEEIRAYTFASSGLTTLVIPDGVTDIQDYAFEYCEDLTTVVMPASVEYIAYEAFLACESLTDVYYMGTEAQWNEILIESDNEPLTNANIHFNWNTEPEITKLENTASGVKVTWDAVDGAENYRLFVKTSKGWATVGTTTDTSLTYTGAKSGYAYTFTVRCLNAEGTAFTSFYNADGWKQTYVAQPAISKLENTASGIKITWNAVAGAGKYRVYAKTSTGWLNIGTTAGTSLTYTGAKSGYTYTFTVRALNSAGTAFVSSYNTTGLKQTYVAQPTISKLENTASGIKITWGAVNGAGKYRVFVKTSKGWATVGTTTGTSLTYTGTKSGYTYTFTVRALNSAGTAFVSSYNGTGWKQTYVAQPSISKLENTASGIKITWNAVSGAGKYRVFVKTSKGWATVGTTSGTSLTYTGAKSGYTYTFTVRALNSAGTAFVSSYNGTGWKQTYVARPSITKLTNTTSGINISWGAVNGAAKYRVFVKTSSGWKAIGTTTGTSFTWSGATKGVTYTFTVRCLNSAGTAYTSAFNSTGWSIKRT